MHGFTWSTYLPDQLKPYEHMLGSVLVLVLITFFALAANNRLKRCNVVPDKKISLASFFEMISDMFLGLMENLIGKRAPRYLPLVGSIFVYVLISNLLGLIPGFNPPTNNINTNLAVAVVVFLLTHYYGVREVGAGKYAQHFLAPIAGIGGLLLSVLFTPIELVSHVFRPASLSVRLWGNMVGDHMVLDMMQGFVPFFFLGLIVCVMQAFVFALLTVVYIALATAHDH